MKVYKTEAGSILKIHGNGLHQLEFDWLEEPGACCDCVPSPYPYEDAEDNLYIIWQCEYCGYGKARIYKEK